MVFWFSELTAYIPMKFLKTFYKAMLLPAKTMTETAHMNLIRNRVYLFETK